MVKIELFAESDRRLKAAHFIISKSCSVLKLWPSANFGNFLKIGVKPNTLIEKGKYVSFIMDSG